MRFARHAGNVIRCAEPIQTRPRVRARVIPQWLRWWRSSRDKPLDIPAGFPQIFDAALTFPPPQVLDGVGGADRLDAVQTDGGGLQRVNALNPPAV